MSLKAVAQHTLQGIAFVHEIMARKWFYHGYHLEHYPRIYHHVPLLNYQDLGLIQMLLVCDNTEDDQGSSMEMEEISTSSLINDLIEHCDLDG